MAATPCFFTRFAYFVDTKFSSVVSARSSLSSSFSLSLSLSLSLSCGRRRDNDAAMMTKSVSF